MILFRTFSFAHFVAILTSILRRTFSRQRRCLFGDHHLLIGLFSIKFQGRVFLSLHLSVCVSPSPSVARALSLFHTHCFSTPFFPSLPVPPQHRICMCAWCVCVCVLCVYVYVCMVRMCMCAWCVLRRCAAGHRCGCRCLV